MGALAPEGQTRFTRLVHYQIASRVEKLTFETMYRAHRDEGDIVSNFSYHNQKLRTGN
jgi:repressor of nif and glnA expression